MNPQKPAHPRNLQDFDPEIENDALWSLLDEASSTQASPRFTSDTLRRLRLEDPPPQMPWWKKLLAPKPLIATATAALAAIAVVVSIPQEPSNDPIEASAPSIAPVEDWEVFEDALAQELLSGAAEDPSLLSDEEIVALLF